MKLVTNEMSLTFYKNYEILDIQGKKLVLNQQKGNLLIELLNNFDEIKKALKIEINAQNTIGKFTDMLYTIPFENEIYSPNIIWFYHLLIEEVKSIYEKNRTIELIDNTKVLKKPTNDKINLITDFLSNIIATIKEEKEFLENYTDLQQDIYYKKLFLPSQDILFVKEDKRKKSLTILDEQYQKNSSRRNVPIAPSYVTVFHVNNLFELFSIYNKFIFDKEIYIKQCKNCKKLFITKSRSDEKYCDNIAPQSKKSTCKEYAPKKTYKDKYLNSNLNKEYIRFVQTLRMKIQREKNYQRKTQLKNMLKSFQKEYTEKIQNNKLKEQDIIIWISEYREKYKKTTHI